MRLSHPNRVGFSIAIVQALSLATASDFLRTRRHRDDRPYSDRCRALDRCSIQPPLSDASVGTYGDLSLADAYEIQDALRAELEGRGKQPIGWKLAATAPTGQAIMGVKEPAYGFLPPHQYAAAAEVSASGFADLRVEAEVAFRMRTKLVGPGVTAASAVPAV